MLRERKKANLRSNQMYAKMVSGMSPKSEMKTGMFSAFWVGGTICVIGQVISDCFTNIMQWGSQRASISTSIVLICLSSLLTGFGQYDRIGKYAGAGSIVPITGFANSITAPAMEYRREGLVMGVGAKLFTLAGPVLVYGITSSVIIGVIVFLLG